MTNPSMEVHGTQDGVESKTGNNGVRGQSVEISSKSYNSCVKETMEISQLQQQILKIYETYGDIGVL